MAAWGYEFYLLILSAREDKIRILVRPCNILYIWYRLWQTFIEILGTTTLTKARLKDKEHTIINALIKAVRKQDLEYALVTKLFNIMFILVSVTYFGNQLYIIFLQFFCTF